MVCTCRHKSTPAVQIGNTYALAHSGRARMHFGLWALLKAPLLIGADLRSLHRADLALLKSPGILAINQDSLGVAGDLVLTHGSTQARASFSDSHSV